MPIIYGVVSGEYSDYRIHCLWSDYAAAELHRDKLTASDARIQEFTLDPMTLDELYSNLLCYRVWFTLDGNISDVDYEEDPISINEIDQYPVSGPPGSYNTCVDVMARNPEHARKIAGDLYAKAKAMGKIQ